MEPSSILAMPLRLSALFLVNKVSPVVSLLVLNHKYRCVKTQVVMLLVGKDLLHVGDIVLVRVVQLVDHIMSSVDSSVLLLGTSLHLHSASMYKYANWKH